MSVSGIGPISPVQQTTSPTVSPSGKPANTASTFGSGPAAVVSLSAQAQTATAKGGHDTDGDSDGK